jgi:hypothetical protein
MKRRARRSLEGAVYAETLLLIPVFLAVFGAVILIYDAHSTAISTTAASRNASLAAGSRGCDSLPAGCSLEDVDLLPDVPEVLSDSVRSAKVRRARCTSSGSYGGGSVTRGHIVLCMEDPGAAPDVSPTGAAPSLR